MDFGSELFWVIMVIVYLVFQVLGARKKRQQHREQRPTPQDRRPVSAPRKEEEVELDEALREIRRALGFPDDQPEAPPREEASPLPTDDAWIPPGEDRPPTLDAQPEIEPAEEHPAEAVPPQDETTVARPSMRREPSKLPPRLGDSRVRRRPERSTAQKEGLIFAPDEKEGMRRGTTYEKLDETPAAALSPSDSLVPPPPTPKGSGLSDVAIRLRNPTSARQAFLMKEILDLPRALRGRR